MTRHAAWILLTLLVLVRLPSLVQPAGADQDLYAYVGQEISRGGLPYLDAWDQKPPAIHYTYALLYRVWPHPSVVAAADLMAAVLVAFLLTRLERRMTGGPGVTAAIVFLALGNPVFSRLGGMWLRAQCETFIALAIAGSLLCLHAATHTAVSRRGRTWAWRLLAGLLVGLAAAFKYNAAVYGLAALAAAAAWRRHGRREEPAWARAFLQDAAGLAAGAALPLAFLAARFAAAGAWDDLWQATVTYNLLYSGETYRGAGDLVRYAVTFPVQQARIDGLWTAGGAGCLVLLTRMRRDPGALVALAWVAAACAAIVVNGGRGLPQYFVQANPALALSAALGAWHVYRASRTHWVASIAGAVMLFALARVVPLQKGIDATVFDARHASGAIPREEYLARFGGQRPTDKHVPVAVLRLGRYLAGHSAPSDTVFVCGFAQGALVQSNRRSASRFFWSRPLVVGFNEGRPGYGAAGLLDDLRGARPAIVALQVNDWQMEGTDSAGYFMSRPALAAWLHAGFVRQPDLDNFQIWLRRPS
ncbi:MAG: glycosyltransferase family 39 protein [Vicinamibacterales bacterium]